MTSLIVTTDLHVLLSCRFDEMFGGRGEKLLDKAHLVLCTSVSTLKQVRTSMNILVGIRICHQNACASLNGRGFI